MIKVNFVEKEQIYVDETTRYWFEVIASNHGRILVGSKFAMVHNSVMDEQIIDHEGQPVDPMDWRILEPFLTITDEMICD